MDLLPGQSVLGRYVIEALLAEGSAGIHYAARHQRFGHQVVIWVLRNTVTQETAARFKRAAMLMARIRHINVVSIMDFGVVGGDVPCVVTEFTGGDTLRKRLTSEGPMSWPDAVHHVLQVLAGLEAIHEAGVLHRNLKPDNIMVLGDDQQQLVKLIDLRFAKSIFDEGPAITQLGTVAGTPAYMSPEQLNFAPIDARSDIYASALVLYELITGGLPTGTDVDSLLSRITSAPPPPASPAGFPDVPPALEQLLVAALDPEPSRRPSSASDFGIALRGCLRAALQQQQAQLAAGGQGEPASWMSAMRRRSSLRMQPRTVYPDTPAEPPMPRKPTATGVPKPSAAPVAHQKPAYETEPLVEEPPREAEEAVTVRSSEMVDQPSENGNRIRGIVGARLEATLLDDSNVRRWLAQPLDGGDRCFTVGPTYWLATIWTADYGTARRRARALIERIEERFGEEVAASWTPVDESFQLTSASVGGGAPPPYEIMELLERIA